MKTFICQTLDDLRSHVEDDFSHPCGLLLVCLNSDLILRIL